MSVAPAFTKAGAELTEVAVQDSEIEGPQVAWGEPMASSPFAFKNPVAEGFSASVLESSQSPVAPLCLGRKAARLNPGERSLQRAELLKCHIGHIILLLHLM